MKAMTPRYSSFGSSKSLSEPTPAERAIVIDVEAFDWNCPQHITPRYTQEELVDILAPCDLDFEIWKRKMLSCENQRARNEVSDSFQPPH